VEFRTVFVDASDRKVFTALCTERNKEATDVGVHRA